MSTKELLEELKERGVTRIVLEFSGTDDSGGRARMRPSRP